jgi:hypothetical protein
MVKPTIVDGFFIKSNNQPDFTGQKAVIAVGDSWFSIGAIPPWSTSNLIENLLFTKETTLVYYGIPGQEVSDMSNPGKNPRFVSDLTIRGATAWDAILVSGGGNDVLAFAGMPATLPDGSPRPQGERLFLTRSEWNPNDQTAMRYISQAGCSVLANNMQTYYSNIVALRDQSANPEARIFAHTYDYPTPRNLGIPLVAPHGWIYPIMLNYFIPSADWDAVAKILMDQISLALIGIAQGSHNFNIVDTRNTLVPAPDGGTSPSADWENEIHPTQAGYTKLAAVWNGEFAKVGL